MSKGCRILKNILELWMLKLIKTLSICQREREHKKGKQQTDGEAGSLLTKEPDGSQSQDPGIMT